ncbi:MAG: pilus assembly protein PilM [Thermoguttaceae bacterium]
MVHWCSRQRFSPIGVDIGSRSVKLLQFDAARTRVHEAVRWDLPAEPATKPDVQDDRLIDAIRHAREDRRFRGREAVFCLSADNLFVQNIRVSPASGDELTKIVHFEAAGRLPFTSEEAEIRYLEADDVRQGDTLRREVILMACHQPAIQRLLAVAEASGLRPASIDVEPSAMLRCYHRQFRRDNDQQRRMMFVRFGASNTVVLVARGPNVMFVKYLDFGGRHFDEAISRHLKMTLPDAAALRRHNGDRRADQRDPEIERSIDESIRPALDKLTHELSLCLRYYSVTFRGQPLSKIVLGGGEATQPLADWFTARLDVPCELGDPMRPFDKGPAGGRATQWDIAAGLALRDVE